MSVSSGEAEVMASSGPASEGVQNHSPYSFDENRSWAYLRFRGSTNRLYLLIGEWKGYFAKEHMG